MKKTLTIITLLLSFGVIAQPTDYVAYYPFNGNASDESGNGNNGTVSGATMTTDRFGNANSAYDFDGIDDFIEIDGALLSATDINSGNASISLWAFVESLPGDGIDIISINDINSTSSSSILMEPTGISIQNRDGAGGSTFPLTEEVVLGWHHVVANFDAGTVTLYIDGIPYGSQTGFSVTSLNKTIIGADQNTGGTSASSTVKEDFYNSLIDDIRVYNRSLMESEIQELFLEDGWSSLNSGLALNYLFEGNANDVSPNGNNGAENGGVAYGLDRFGSSSGAASFDGVDDFIEVGNLEFFNSDFAASLWVKVYEVTAGQNETFISESDGDFDKGFNLNRRSVNNKVRLTIEDETNDRFVVESTSDLKVGEWVHLAAIRSGDEIKLFFNGQLEGSTAISNWDFTTITNDFRIGIQGVEALDRLNGNIDELRLYNRALSDQEVQDLYEQERPSFTDALVASYTLDGNGNDDSGNGNNGSITGNVETIADRFDNASSALRFNGGFDDKVLGDDSGFPFGASERTIVGWVRKSTMLNEGHVLEYGSTSQTGGKFGLGILSNVPFFWGHNDDLSGSTNIIDGKWHFLAATYDGSTVKLYLDGSEEASQAIALNTVTDGDFNIGSGDLDNYYGDLDQVRLYGRALSSNEILELYNQEKIENTDGLVAFYTFTGNADDESGGNNDGTVNGAALTTDRLGNANSAYSFDGVDDQIALPSNLILSTANEDFSYSIWVNPNETTNETYLLDFQGEPFGSTRLRYLNDNLELQSAQDGPSSWTAKVTTTTPIGSWSHLAATYSTSSGWKLYKNGVEVGSDGTITDFLGQTSVSYVGAKPGPENFLNGLVDDIRVYNRILSDSEVLDIYNQEKPSIVDGVVAYYPFSGDATDNSGNGNDGAETGGVDYTAEDRFGDASSAVSFNGVDGNINYGDLSMAGAELSVFAWVYLESLPSSFAAIVSKDEDYEILVNDVGELLFAINNENLDVFSPTKLEAGKWYFVGGIHDGSSSKIFIDGQEDIATSYVAAIENGSTKLLGVGSRIFSNLNKSFFLDGRVDEVRLYNRAISEQEVLDLYQLDAPDFNDGLVGYYPFDGDQVDASGTGNNATNSGGTNAQDRLGNEDQAIGLDGVDDFLSVADNSSLDLTTFTLSGWMYLNQAVPSGQFYNMFFKGEAGDPGVTNYALSVNDEQNLNAFYEYGAGDNVGLEGTTIISPQTWYHFSSTYDGTDFKIYINGSEEATLAESNAPGTNDETLFLGSNVGGTSFLDGSLDELRIYNRAFTAFEIQQLYEQEAPPAATDGLIASYDFAGDETDASGNGNDGTGTGVVLASDRFGTADEAYAFDGDDLISVPDLGVKPENLTVAAWFNYPSGSGDNTHNILEIPGAAAVAVFENNFQTVLSLGSTFLTPVTFVDSDIWHLGVFTYDGTTFKSYLDGVLFDEQTNSDQINYLAAETLIKIGTNSDENANFFTGSIDQVKLFDRALTAGEVEDLYVESGWTQITDFIFAEQTGAAIINQDSRTINIDVAHGTNVHTLTANITVPSAFVVWYEGSEVLVDTEIDYTDPITLEVRYAANTNLVASTYTVNVTQSHPNNINFEKLTNTLATAFPEWAVGSTWADFDNDSYPDLYLSTWDFNTTPIYKNSLLLNDQAGDFGGDVLASFDKWEVGNAVDFDNDGDIDVVGPSDDNDWANGANKVFYVNGGSGVTFTRADLTVPASINAEAQLVWNSGWADYDNDGDLDVMHLLQNDNSINRFFDNNGDGTFTENTSLSITTVAGGSLDISWPDVDNDGDVDLFIANGGSDGEINDEFYFNDGDGTFTRVTSGDIVSENLSSEGASWGDLNNDGFIDAIVTSVDSLLYYVNNGDGTFTSTLNAITAGPTNSIGSALGDYDNDGDLDVFVSSFDNGVINRLWQNDGTGDFTEVTGTLINEVASSWGVTWVDYDRDGDLDLYVANANQKNYLYRNTQTAGNYIGIKLNGAESNRLGIGARIVVEAENEGAATGLVTQMRQVLSTSGSRSQQETTQHFGLKSAPIVENITVYWPSGRVNSLNSIPTNQYIEINENDGLLAYYSFNGNLDDESTNNLAGFEEGGLTLTTDRLGNADQAYAFDGVDDRFRSFNLPQPTLITVAGWLNTTTDYTGGYANIIDMPGALGLGIGSANGVSGILFIDEGDFVAISSTETINDGSWHHVAMSYDGANVKLYLDGVKVNEIAEGDGSVYYADAVQELRIGYSTDGTDRWFNGAIDEIRVYDSGLSDAEILAIYDEERAEVPFVTTWQTTTANENINIPIGLDGEVYDYTVDWGDGTVESNFTADANHTYATAGTYTVSITGTFPRIFFNNGEDGQQKTKILSIEQWGEIAWSSMESAFYGCSNLTYNASDTPDLSSVTTMQRAFNQCPLFDGDLSSWDVSNIQNFSDMFFSATAFNGDVTTWNMSAATELGGMFFGCSSFNQDIGNWDVRQVVGFGQMLDGATIFDQDLSGWDISSAASMGGMLNNAGMSKANYDLTLVGWATLETGETSIPTNITLGATGLTYCAAADARADLINNFSWTIEGDAESCTLEDLLIVDLPFNGSANNEAGDGFDGTVTGGVALTSDRLSNVDAAYNFDGEVGSEISLANSTDLFSEDIFTVVAWVKPEAGGSSNTQMILGGDVQILYFDDSNTVDFQVVPESGSISVPSSSTTIPVDQWSQIVVSYDDTTLKKYINGVLDASESGFAGIDLITSSQNVTLGSQGDAGSNNSNFKGDIDDFRVYERALTDQEVADLYNTEQVSQLIASYPFSGNANDASGNGIDGTVSGAVLTTDRLGDANSAYSFDGVDDFISFTDTDFVGGLANVSVAWWQNVTTTGDADVLSFGNFRARVSSGFVTLNPFIDASATAIGTTVVNDVWEHYVYTFDGSNTRLYKNGVIADNVAKAGVMDTFNGTAYIGTFQNTNQYLDGAVDEVKIYETTLSDVDVLALYDSERLLNNESNITEFTITDQLSSEIIDGESRIIVVMPNGTDLTSLTPSITFSEGADVSPDPTLAQDFANTVSYTVTSEDESSVTAWEVDVFALPVVSDGLIAYYPFNNGTVKDESGNKNDGVINGAIPSEDRLGNSMSAFSFDGENDDVEINDGTGISLDGDFAINVWINQSQLRSGDFAYVVNNNGASANSLVMIGDAPSAQYVNSANTGFGSVVATTSLSLNQWYMLSVTRFGDEFSLYIDGVLSVSETPTDIFAEVDHLFQRIGSNIGSSSQFQGSIDQVRIYNRPLTASEVSQIYDDERPPVPVTTISSISTFSASPGDQVTISGSNFSDTGNIVLFEGVRANVLSESSSQISATVPQGAAQGPIQVISNGQVAYSSQIFDPSFAAFRDLGNASDFEQLADFTVATSPIFFTHGDLDLDGDQDLIIANNNAGLVQIFENTSVGDTVTFNTVPIELSTSVGPFDVELGDFDLDGLLDIVCSNNQSNSVSFFLNTSAGGISFASKSDVAVGAGPFGLSAGDLNNDGKPDLAVTSTSSNVVSIRINTSTGDGVLSFEESDDLVVSGSSADVKIADLSGLSSSDADGKADIIVTDPNVNQASVFINTTSSTLSFAPRVDVTTATAPGNIEVGYIDSDALLDVMVVSTSSSNLTILRNSGIDVGTSTITFDRQDISIESAASGVDVGDINGDGLSDIVTANNTSNTRSVLINRGGDFDAAIIESTINLTGTNAPGVVRIVDLNNDGAPEIISSNEPENTMSIFRNTVADEPAGLVAYYPFSGNVEDQSGNGNDLVLGDNSTTSLFPVLTTDRLDVADRAYAFDGVDDYMALNTFPSTITQDFTVSGWIKIKPSSTGPRPIIEFQAPSSLVFQFQEQDQSLDFVKTNSDGTETVRTSSTMLPTDEWIQVAVTNQGTSTNLFFNGALIDSFVNTDNIRTDADAIIVGGNAQDESFNGDLDEIRIYDQALTADEILAIYNLERPAPNNTPADITLSNDEISEGLPVNTVIGQFSTVDPDVNDTHIYNLVSGTGDTDNASFDLTAEGELSSGEIFDSMTKSSYTIRVQTDDQRENGTFEKSFTITILESMGNAPTEISITSNSIDENNALDAVIGSLSTTDPDDPEGDDTYTYSLVAGDTEDFAIDGTNLIAKSVFNFEDIPSYTLTIRTLDDGNNPYDSVDFMVNINDVNEAPVLASFTGTVAENAAQGTVIGTVSATDPDGDANLTFSMVDNASNFEFAAVDGTSANLVVLDNAILDYESRQSLDVQVKVADAGSLEDSQIISFAITNVNPRASDFVLSNTTIIEGAPDGTSIGNLSIAGEEAKSSFTFSLADGSSEGFLIDGNTIKLDNLTGGGGTYSLIIDATNDVGASGITADQVSNTFTIEVTNVNTESQVSFGTNVANYRIIGIPTGSAQVSQVFPELQSADQGDKWRVVSYANGNISDLATNSSMTAGRGYWFLSSESTTISLGGLPPVQDAEFNIQLGTEWNLISNPFLESLNVSDAIAYNVSQGFIADGDVSSLFAYNENVINSLDVFQGGWIRNTTGSTLSLILPNPSSNAFGRLVDVGQTVEDSWFADEENWQLILYMQDGERISNLSAVGMRSDALQGLDRNDLLAPPLISDELSFRMSEENGLVRNFKPLASGHAWSYQITAPLHDRVLLSWDAAVVSQLGKGLYIYDPVRKVSYDMSIVNAVELSAGASFEVLYGDEISTQSIRVPLTIYPNPAVEEVAVQFYVESENEEISAKLTIFDIDGKEIMEVEESFSNRSVATFEIDELNLSSGTYMIQVGYDGKNSHTEKLIVR